MQKRNLFATGLVMLCAAGATGYYLFNKPHEGTRDIAPSSSVSAAALFADYQLDEQQANRKFLGKVVQVSGVVAEISHSDTVASLILGSTLAGGINCSFSGEKTDGLQNIHAGDSVSCKGRCTGFLMDVNLSDCVLVSRAQTLTK